MSRVILAKPIKLSRSSRIGVDDDVRPKLRAVLADAPAFPLEASFARGSLERVLRQSGGPILFGIEAGEMLADDLVGEVALDALGARVPVGHVSFGIEHVDGVIGDALDQQAEAAPRFA